MSAGYSFYSFATPLPQQSQNSPISIYLVRNSCSIHTETHDSIVQGEREKTRLQPIAVI